MLKKIPREAVYMIIDIRDSSKLNRYIKTYFTEKKLINFYHKFSRDCLSIASEKYKCIFSKQIGDRLDFAWDKKNVNYAIKCAIEIFNKCNGKFTGFYPSGIKIGIGIACGKVTYDEKFNELKGDCPRIAEILQEKKVGIFIESSKKCKLPSQYVSINYTSVSHGEIFYAKQIIKRKKIQEHRSQNTRNFLKQIDGIAGDMHYHIEGSPLNGPEMSIIVRDAFLEIENTIGKDKNFQAVTGKKIIKIRNQFKNPAKQYFETSKKKSFDTFLSKLLTAKASLCSTELSAYRFTRQVLEELLISNPTFSVSLTPSIPSDFPYLDREKWNCSICEAFKNTLKLKNQLMLKPIFVLETKRQHLLNDMYLGNLKLLKHLHDNVPQLQLAISICDDASKTPLSSTENQKKFKDYIFKAKAIYPDIQVRVHELEQFDSNDPLGEIDFLLNFFDKYKIHGVSWIHLSYMNSNYGICTKQQTQEYLEKFTERKDSIINCFSSNRSLGVPFLLDDKIAFEYLLKQKLNWALGTDNPQALGISDINSEMKIFYIHMIKQHEDSRMVDEAVRILTKNTWKQWSKDLNNWSIPHKKLFSEKVGFDKEEFYNFFNTQTLFN